jgi:hypothetical protein
MAAAMPYPYQGYGYYQAPAGNAFMQPRCQCYKPFSCLNTNKLECSTCIVENLKRSLLWGARYLTGENLKVVLAEFSTLS